MLLDDSWEKMLDRECALYKHAIATKDFTFLAIRQAKTKPSQSQSFISDKDRRAFNKMHETTAISARTNTGKFKDHVESNENNNQDEGDWTSDLDDQEKVMTEQAQSNIHKEFTDGKAYIRANVAPNKRKEAASAFVEGAQKVVDLFGDVFGAIEGVFKMVIDFLNKIWKGIEEVWNTVKGLVGNFLGGLLLAMPPQSELLDVTLDWPETFNFSAVMSDLSVIFSQLVDTQMHVYHQVTVHGGTGVDLDVKPKNSIKTIVTLRVKRGATGVTTDNMKQEWDRIVAGIVKTTV